MTERYSLDGLCLSKMQHAMLSYLITSLVEYDEFITSFWRGTKDCQNLDITNYLLYKVDKMNLDFSTFRELFDDDPKNSFEVLTQRPVTKAITSTIINEINKGTITLEIIFDNYKLNKVRPILRIVKDCI